MTPRRPEYTRPFSREYQAACGRVVERTFPCGPFREYVDAAYVAWLEAELIASREQSAREGKKGERR